jgi:hypothetical protein
MKDKILERQIVIEYIRTHEPLYFETNFDEYSFTQLVILKTEIEVKKPKR